jgi:TRAP-type C4-dicarboxylate transport system permease small subunit
MRIERLAHYTVAVINQVSRAAGILALIFLLAMMVLTVSDVFLRYFFNHPILGSIELVEYFMVVAGFLGIAWCAIKGGHVKVDLLLSHLPPRIQTIIDSFTLFLTMTVVPLVAWQGFAQARRARHTKSASAILEIPDYPFYFVVGISFTLLFLVQVILLVKYIARAIKR